MAKVSRSVLKKLVKECLVEILFEGLDDDGEVLEENKRSRPRRSSQKQKEAEEFQRVAVERKKMLRERTRPQVDGKKLASQITDDPIMAEIFAQTAQTTLPGMINAESRHGHMPVATDGASRIVQENDLEDLFEGAGNWATLAFSSKTKPG